MNRGFTTAMSASALVGLGQGKRIRLSLFGRGRTATVSRRRSQDRPRRSGLLHNALRVPGLALIAVLIGCGGDSGSTAGPAGSGDDGPTVAAVDASGRFQADLGDDGGLRVESGVFLEGVQFAARDTLGRAVGGLRVEYLETPDSIVVARFTDPSGQFRETIFAGNPADLANLRLVGPPKVAEPFAVNS